MAFDTYNNLKSAIIDELDRDDLTSKVDDFIDLAEARHKEEIRFRGMIKRSQASASTRYVALPGDFLEMEMLRILSDPVAMPQQVDLVTLTRYRQAIDGIPAYFSIHEEIEFDVDIADASPLTVEMVYYGSLTALSDSNTSNALLTRAPGCYFYGALVTSASWLSEDARVSTWNSLYNASLDALLLSDRRSRHGSGLATRVVGTCP